MMPDIQSMRPEKCDWEALLVGTPYCLLITNIYFVSLYCVAGGSKIDLSRVLVYETGYSQSMRQEYGDREVLLIDKKMCNVHY